MKILFPLFIALLSTNVCYAVETQFPGESPPAATSADVITTPQKYYPPQKPILNDQGNPMKNPSQNPGN